MKLLVASDLHYIPNLAEEIAVNQHRVPAIYNHLREGKPYWHNLMLVEAGEALMDGLEAVARQEQTDLLIYLGDMVNVNWEKSIAGAAPRFQRFPCPVRQVTGNHDIYLPGDEFRLQEAVVPGSSATGIRHEVMEGLGLIYLDLFARSATGEFAKWSEPMVKAHVDYRPEDIAAAFALMEAAPETPWLIFGHFPFVAPKDRVDVAGRKMGRLWPSTSALATHLEQPNNLVGMFCGHQHFAHFQPFAHGFHWTMPALVEYPCAAAVVEWDGQTLQGRIVPVDGALATTSLHPLQETWTAGDASDQAFVWPVNR